MSLRSMWRRTATWPDFLRQVRQAKRGRAVDACREPAGRAHAPSRYFLVRPLGISSASRDCPSDDVRPGRQIPCADAFPARGAGEITPQTVGYSADLRLGQVWDYWQLAGGCWIVPTLGRECAGRWYWSLFQPDRYSVRDSRSGSTRSGVLLPAQSEEEFRRDSERRRKDARSSIRRCANNRDLRKRVRLGPKQ